MSKAIKYVRWFHSWFYCFLTNFYPLQIIYQFRKKYVKWKWKAELIDDHTLYWLFTHRTYASWIMNCAYNCFVMYITFESLLIWSWHQNVYHLLMHYRLRCFPDGGLWFNWYRQQLFSMINSNPTLYEIVSGTVKMPAKEETSNASRKDKSRSKKVSTITNS